jgi:hypothetical protein
MACQDMLRLARLALPNHDENRSSREHQRHGQNKFERIRHGLIQASPDVQALPTDWTEQCLQTECRVKATQRTADRADQADGTNSICTLSLL